jgi:hypothetical protein
MAYNSDGTQSFNSMQSNRMVFWNVYLNGRCIDSVPYTESCDAEYVRKSLIDHDGYDPRIKVSLAK